MACLNCTASVLRVFIHDTNPAAFSPLRHGALQRPPAMRMYPNRLVQFRTFRRESSHVKKYQQQQAAVVSDDDYLPFVDLPPVLSPSSQAPAPSPTSSSAARRAITIPRLGDQNSTRRGKKPTLQMLDKVLQKKLSVEEATKKPRRKKDCWDLPPPETLFEKPQKSKWSEYVQGKNKRDLPLWMTEKAAREKKYGAIGYRPLKKLSPEAIEGIRALHAQHPDEFPTPKLARLFEVTPEAIQRILRTKWQPTTEEQIDRMKRWERREKDIWEAKVASGEILTKSMKNQIRKAREKWGLAGGVSSKFL